jgi:hypothetical protein
MSKWRYVRHEGGILYDIGILDDGTLHNPNGYATMWSAPLF